MPVEGGFINELMFITWAASAYNAGHEYNTLSDHMSSGIASQVIDTAWAPHKCQRTFWGGRGVFK